MKPVFPPCYHGNAFVASHALEHMMYSRQSASAQVHKFPQSHYGDKREGTLFFFMITFFKVGNKDIKTVSVSLMGTLNSVCLIYSSDDLLLK